MGSSRLPGKVLMDMAGKPMLERILEHAISSKLLTRTVVATSDRPENQAVVDLCKRIGVPVYTGSETDVLGRMWAAAEAERADVMVRLTGDNPMVTGDLVDHTLTVFQAKPNDYDYVHTLGNAGWPHGMAVEAVRMSALQSALQSSDALDREHVTYFIRNRPDIYRHFQVLCPSPCGNETVTVDTLDQFEKAQKIFRYMENGNVPVTYSNFLKILKISPGAIR